MYGALKCQIALDIHEKRDKRVKYAGLVQFLHCAYYMDVSLCRVSYGFT